MIFLKEFQNAKKYDYAVYIGRFSVFHNGHLETVTQALQFSNNVIILIGSSNRARDPKNPWKFNERLAMMRQALEYEGIPMGRIFFHPLKDYSCDTFWNVAVQEAVAKFSFPDSKVCLTGLKKDDSSYLLK